MAKVDSAAVQDGFDLYLHGFFVTDDGAWTVVQQGMNGQKRQARRYHWHSGDLSSFVDEPHSAIDGPSQGEIVNLTDRRAGRSRQAQLDLLTLGPDRVTREFAKLSEKPSAQLELPHLVMPAHHDVRSEDVFIRRLHGTLAAAADRGPVDFPDLLLTPGVGARRGAVLFVEDDSTVCWIWLRGRLRSPPEAGAERTKQQSVWDSKDNVSGIFDQTLPLSPFSQAQGGKTR